MQLTHALACTQLHEISETVMQMRHKINFYFLTCTTHVFKRALTSLLILFPEIWKVAHMWGSLNFFQLHLRGRR